LIKEPGSVIVCNCVHRPNAALCISVIVFGNITEDKALQLKNVESFIIVTLFGIVIEVKPVQY
jgi:hypothetical protein